MLSVLCRERKNETFTKLKPGFQQAGHSQRALWAPSWPGRCCRERWWHHPPQTDRWRWQYDKPQGTPPPAGSALWCPGQSPFLKFSINRFTFCWNLTSSLLCLEDLKHGWNALKYLHTRYINKIRKQGLGSLIPTSTWKDQWCPNKACWNCWSWD